jgi:AcrR family transcriptional regulator
MAYTLLYAAHTVIVKGMPSTSPKDRDESTTPNLPPGLDVLWGLRGGGQRGPKPGLTVDAIVDAAVALADADGLGVVSMANVAKRVGFTPMSLYRYVASKEELLQLMWNASASGAETVVLTGRAWRARLRQWAVIQREMLDRHPWITQMPMASPPMAPNSLTFVERGLEAMDGADLTDNQKMRAIGLLSSYTLSEARMAFDARRAAIGAGAQASESFEDVLRLVVDEANYPRLHRMAWSSDARRAPDERVDFLNGVDCILDGIQAQVSRNKSTKQRPSQPSR